LGLRRDTSSADNICMSAIAFDTHAFVKRLTGAGMPEPQAEALADEQKRLLDDQIATKRDLEDVRRDIAEVRRDIREAEQRLTIRLGVMLAAAVAILGALVSLF
jgi:hypothetical protein